MQGYNVVAVYNYDMDRVLMCRRRKDPFKGLINFVGGKIEKAEDGISAAYRELYEETAIPRELINLKHLMDFTYFISDCYIEVYVGRLKGETEVLGSENELFWSGLDCDFFDMKAYAGVGNIGHIFEEIKFHRNELF